MGIAPLRLLPQTSLLRCPKISAAFALKFLTAAPYPARFFRHWRRFAGYAHQGETPSNTVLNEFPTMRAKRCWGRSTGQRLPPPRIDFRTIGHIAELSYQGGSLTVGRGPPFEGGSGVGRGAQRVVPPWYIENLLSA